MLFVTKKEPETTLIVTLNGYYRNFLLNYSCCVYMLVAVVLLYSIHYYLSYWKQYRQLRRRRQTIRRANQRIARRHRPYAVSREHEIFRKIMRTVREYQARLGEHKHDAIETLRSHELLLYCDANSN